MSTTHLIGGGNAGRGDDDMCEEGGVDGREGEPVEVPVTGREKEGDALRRHCAWKPSVYSIVGGDHHDDRKGSSWGWVAPSGGGSERGIRCEAGTHKQSKSPEVPVACWTAMRVRTQSNRMFSLQKNAQCQCSA